MTREAVVRTIAIVNQKGGCGKTTTAINLAAVCARKGHRTLVVDMDPQSHCAAGLGVPDESLEQHIGNALTADLSRGFDRSRLVWEVSRNLDLAPSTMSLAALEAPGGGLHQLPDKDRRLAMLLKHLAPHYDRCLIDCPPTIGLLTYNALRAAGEAIIPVETGYFALRGAKKQWETIRNLVDRVGHAVTCYVLPTLFNEEELIAKDILGSIRKQFGGRVIPIVIRERSEIREAASYGQPVSEYAADSAATKDFEALADWLENHPADPPEVQIDVTRSVTVPWEAGETAPASAGAPVAAQPVSAGESSRAAEMARRVRQLSSQRAGAAATKAPAESESIDTVEAAVAAAAVTPVDPRFLAAQRRGTLVETKDLPPQLDGLRSNIVRSFGVRQTAHGVLFIQPGAPGSSICIAADFNGWSVSASPLRYNRDSGVHELILPLPRGRYEYRLVIDGVWQSDPYNPRRKANQYGVDNNFFEVT
jgi:chromosome partitioning protein